MSISDSKSREQHFPTIEALLIHKGVCRAKTLSLALGGLSTVTLTRIRNGFREAYPEATVPSSASSTRGWVRSSSFTARYLKIPDGMTQDQAAHQHLHAIDILRGTNLADVEAVSLIPILAPIIIFNTRDGFRYVYVEEARTTVRPKLNEFATEELEYMMKFPHGSRFAMKTEGRKHRLVCIGSWLEG